LFEVFDQTLCEVTYISV